jgi:hypothetical protein
LWQTIMSTFEQQKFDLFTSSLNYLRRVPHNIISQKVVKTIT